MTPAPRAAPSLDEALGQALEDLEAGLTPLQVLSRYPKYQAELGPLIETAYRLRTTRWPTLSMAARVSGRERMHAALSQQKMRRHFIIAPVWRQLGAGLVLVLLAGTTYIASPFSPLRSSNRPRLTGTVPIATTATWTVAPSATTRPPATVAVLATRGPAVTLNLIKIVEPTETVDPEMGLKHAPPKAAATLVPSATPTRVTPTRVRTATPTPTAVVTATRTPSPVPTTAGPSASSGATVQAPPAPSSTATVAPASPTPGPTNTAGATLAPASSPTTQPSTPTKPTPTPRPKDEGDTATPPPAPTSAPTSAPPPPSPEATDEPTPGAGRTHTPEPRKSSGTTGVKAGAAIPTLVQQAREQGKPPGQVIKRAVQERRQSEPPRGKSGKK